MKKRILTAVLATILAVGWIPTATMAAEITVTEIVPPKYDCLLPFSEGLAVVSLDHKVEFEGLAVVGRDHKVGFIDRNGNEVIPLGAYREVYGGGFHEGLVAVENWGTLGDPTSFSFIDKTGKEVLSLEESRYAPGCFSEGVALTDIGEDYIIIDKTGKVVGQPLRYDLIFDFADGMAVTLLGDKYGVIDKTGTEIVAPKYDRIHSYCDGMAIVELDGKSGFIDKLGTEIVSPKYDYAFDFSEGIARVYTYIPNTYWADTAFVNKSGQELNIPAHGMATDFSEGIAMVKENFGFGYLTTYLIDTSGQTIAYIIEDVEKMRPFHEGLAAICWDGKWRYIDKTGKEAIPALKYDSVGNFSEGVAVVELDGKYGLIDTAGNEILSPQYDMIFDVSNGVATTCVGDPFAAEMGMAKYGLLAISKTGSSSMAYASSQSVFVNDTSVSLQMYALKDANDNPTNYVKLRDVASVLNDTTAQFDVSWDGAVNILNGQAYTPNGSEMTTPFSGNKSYTFATAPTKVNGKEIPIDAIVLTDNNGGAYTYYKLRDLGEAIGFQVDWSAEKGILVQTK